jgi:hypothetical protein
MIEPSDLEISGLSEEEHAKHHTNISVRIVDAVTLRVQSEKKADLWYDVLHDGFLPISCKCPWGSYHKGECQKHFARVQLVLNRRNARLNRETGERRRAEAPLNGNRGFSVLR